MRNFVHQFRLQRGVSLKNNIILQVGKHHIALSHTQIFVYNKSNRYNSGNASSAKNLRLISFLIIRPFLKCFVLSHATGLFYPLRGFCYLRVYKEKSSMS